MGVVPASLDQLVGLGKVPVPLLQLAQRLLLLIELSPLSAQVGLGGHLRHLGGGGGGGGEAGYRVCSSTR